MNSKHKKKKPDSNIKKLMAYIFMPLIFATLGYLLIYLVTFQYVSYATDMVGMIVSKSIPNFSSEGNNSIYDPDDTVVHPTYNPSVTPTPNIADATPDPSGSTPTATPIEYDISRDQIVLPKSGEHYAQISCERIGLDAKVYWGDDRTTLWLGIGQSMYSKWPGYGRPLLMSGHNNTYCKPLENIQDDDIITIRTNWGLYQYKVYDIKVLKYDDETAYDFFEEREVLILYTCYPFGLLATDKSDRLFVYAEKVIGPNWR